jgi:hypothetical protein
MEPKLVYIGKGAFIIGVPARDLTTQDIANLELTEAELLESGLYKPTNEQKADKPKTKKAGE